MYKEVNKEFEAKELRKFVNVGDSVEGYFIGEHNAKTSYGDTLFLDFTTDEGDFSVVASAGLKNVDWNDLQGVKVKIEYVGDKKNKKTGRMFKDFKVMADYDDTVMLDEDDLPY